MVNFNFLSVDSLARIYIYQSSYLRYTHLCISQERSLVDWLSTVKELVRSSLITSDARAMRSTWLSVRTMAWANTTVTTRKTLGLFVRRETPSVSWGGGGCLLERGKG